MISSLSEVPPNWIKVRFDEIAENITDRIDKPNESGLENYIGLEHLDTDQIRIKRFGSTEDVKATKFLCKKGDIIFGKRRSYLRKVAVTDRDAVASAHSMVIRPKGDLIVPEFLPCFMQSSIFWKTAHAISEGSMSPTIKWKTLAKQEFWVPTIEEQKKIVEIILSIQENLDKTDKFIEVTEKIKKELLNELLTNGIGHQKTKSTEIGDIPEKWEIKKLSDICLKIRSGGTPISTKKEYYQGNIMFVKIEDMTGCNKYLHSTKQNISKEGFNSSNAWLIPENSLLYSIYATVGEVRINKIAVTSNQAILGIIPNPEIVNLDFLYYYLEKIKPYLDQYFLETTQKNLTASIVKNLNLGIPTLEEQKHILVKLKKVDNYIKKNTQHLSLIFQLKQKLANDFLSGKLLIPKEVL